MEGAFDIRGSFGDVGLSSLMTHLSLLVLYKNRVHFHPLVLSLELVRYNSVLLLRPLSRSSFVVALVLFGSLISIVAFGYVGSFMTSCCCR